MSEENPQTGHKNNLWLLKLEKSADRNCRIRVGGLPQSHYGPCGGTRLPIGQWPERALTGAITKLALEQFGEPPTVALAAAWMLMASMPIGAEVGACWVATGAVGVVGTTGWRCTCPEQNHETTAKTNQHNNKYANVFLRLSFIFAS